MQPPDWNAILSDDTRNEQEIPWLKNQIEFATDQGMIEAEPGTLYWRGFRDALKYVVEEPGRIVADANARIQAANLDKERLEENARRVRSGRNFLRRLDALPGWVPGVGLLNRRRDSES